VGLTEREAAAEDGSSDRALPFRAHGRNIADGSDP
jgi:hypothetical protein